MPLSVWVLLYFIVGLIIDSLIMFAEKHFPYSVMDDLPEEIDIRAVRTLCVFFWPFILIVGLVVELFGGSNDK